MARKKPVRIGVVGTGGMGSGHCRCLRDSKETELVAVCDIDPEVAARVGEEYGVPYFVKYRDLIKSGLCEAITIATPHPPRPPIAIAAAKAGLHILSEKPLSERISTADKMVAAAKDAGVSLAIMFQRRLEPGMRKAIEIVQSGALGKIFRTTMISPEYRSQAYYDSGGWRATWEGEGGGVMMNQSPHIIDLFILLGGMPGEVMGRVETRIHHIEVEDHADAMLTYPEGGTGYMYCATCEAGPGQMIEVYGENGKLCYRNGQLQFFRFKPGVEEFTRKSTAMWGGPECVEQKLKIKEGPRGHLAIIENFARHIRKGEPLIAPGEEGLRSLELANAVWLSAHTGKKVKLPLSRRAYDDFLREMRRKSTFKKGKVKARRVTDPRHKI